LESNTKPLKIQVVALQWKWLFIYPEQGIATVNFVQFPEQTPINFEITADAPMNSFWIPQLGGQIYAMPGMVAKLHLIADKEGSYRGSSANLSGKGFAGMKFIAKSSSEADFEAWVDSVRQSGPIDYTKVAEPSEYAPAAFYSLSDDNLFNQIVMKYMVP
jgi:cytochrome o ubiquinol oxidase subunit 2